MLHVHKYLHTKYISTCAIYVLYAPVLVFINIENEFSVDSIENHVLQNCFPTGHHWTLMESFPGKAWW